MKKIILWVVIALVGFAISVAVSFYLLTYFGEKDEAPNYFSTEAGGDSDSTLTTDSLVVEISEVDSLKNVIVDLKTELFFNKLVADSLIIKIDSLSKQIMLKEELIESFQESIDKLNNELLSANKIKVDLKELAKTFETMKVAEIRPIIANVDEATVLAIYKYMNSRSRKSIFNALSPQRAAAMTQTIAGDKSKNGTEQTD